MLRRAELAHALVVTLTYPAEFPAPDDHAVYKVHLHTFQIYLRRKWPQCSCIWKLEFQSRGTAHYHFILYGLHDVELEAVRAWVRETWYRIAHNGDKHQGKAGTQVDPIKSVGGAVSYLVKYLSKEDQTMPGNFGGRYWGLHNKQSLPIVEPMTIEPGEKKALLVRRIARRKMQKDVEHSRWKRFLEREWEQFKNVEGGCLGGSEVSASQFQEQARCRWLPYPSFSQMGLQRWRAGRGGWRNVFPTVRIPHHAIFCGSHPASYPAASQALEGPKQ